MDIESKCDDAQLSAEIGSWHQPLDFPSHSYYPPGTVCAKHRFRATCFASGDSGSPLMAEDKTKPGRLYVEGFQSFVKGCDSLKFYARSSSSSSYEGLSQINESPSIYTRLSCFLPWVAEQYDMSYPVEESQQPHCLQSTSSKEVSKECRTNPESDFFQGVSSIIVYGKSEEKCIFPFYYKGKLYDECMVSPTSDFVFQVVCPVRNSTVKLGGINDYGDDDIIQGFCLDEETGDVVTNSSGADCDRYKIFRQCKNNCPGGLKLALPFVCINFTWLLQLKDLA